MPSKRITINRAPVLTLWASVVAERLGHKPDEALRALISEWTIQQPLYPCSNQPPAKPSPVDHDSNRHR